MIAAADLVGGAAEVLAPLRDRLFFNAEPLGGRGRLAFVFPGSGNDFWGMGRELAARWPEVLRRLDAENERLRGQFVADKFWLRAAAPPTPRERIFAQVTLAILVTDLLGLYGVHPDAALGHSLGESSMLFALRAWTDRDTMFARLNESTLFAGDLTAPFAAARATWGVEASDPVDWLTLRVDRAADTVHAAIANLPRVYLLLINAPTECVIGGEAAQVAHGGADSAAAVTAIDDPSTVHCPVVGPVADAYRELHRLPTRPPAGIRFYRAAFGRSYEVNRDSAAEAVLAQALRTVDFPALVESAYADGARVFVEIGPGASCTRMIGAILGRRTHRARSACVPGGDAVSTFLRLLAMMIAERVPVDLRRSTATNRTHRAVNP